MRSERKRTRCPTLHFFISFFAKNERFAQKTNERIPSPAARLSLLFNSTAKPSLLIGSNARISLLFRSTAKPSLLICSSARLDLLICSTARLN